MGMSPGQNYYRFRKGVQQICVWLWIPENATANMPLSVHFPGNTAYSASKYSITRSSLPLLLMNRIVESDAIVVVPQPPRAEKGYEQAIIGAIEDCVARFGTDRDKISLSGWSFGSVLAYDLLGLRPEYFRSAVMVSGRIRSSGKVPTYDRLIAAKGELPPILAYHGTEDGSANPYEVCEEQVSDLQKNGVNINLISFVGSGHGIWGDPGKKATSPAVFTKQDVLEFLFLKERNPVSFGKAPGLGTAYPPHTN